MPPARTRGSITIEIIIAFAVLTLTLSAVVLLIGGNDAERLGREIDELSLAKRALADSRVPDIGYWDIVSTTTLATFNDTAYLVERKVSDESPCLKSVSVRASLPNPKPFEELSDGVELSTYIANTDEAEALGADCDAEPSNSSWKYPTRLAEQSIAGASGTAIDVLDGIAYIGLSAPPYFAIADARAATLGQMQGLILAFQNSFSLYAQPNALDAVILGNDRYVFAAMDATSSQLAVIRVTDALNPVLVATSTLSGVAGEHPEGHRIAYYAGKVYLVTLETAGPELHIYDVNQPSVPREIAKRAIDITLNDIAVRGDVLYAAGQKQGALIAYDVSSVPEIHELSATKLPEYGSKTPHEARSIALIGKGALIGRDSGDYQDMFYFNLEHVEDPPQAVDIGTTAFSLTFSGGTAFLATNKSKKQIQVWNISDPSQMKLLSWIEYPGLAATGLDYENNRLYATGSTTLQIFESI